MFNKKIHNLTEASRKKSLFFEEFFKWKNYSFNQEMIGEIRFMDERLISIYGTAEYNSLSLKKKMALSYYESCEILAIYSTTESYLCLFLAKHLLTLNIGDSEYNFIIRELIEEYRHQDMFERTLKILESQHQGGSKHWKVLSKFEALYRSPKYFFISVLVIEIIAGEFGEKCMQNKKIHKLVSDVTWIHEFEEKRHIAFAYEMLDKYFEKGGFFSRTLGGCFVLLSVMFVNAEYIKLNNFKKLRTKNDKELYIKAKRSWKQNKYRNFTSSKGIKLLQRYKFITWANGWVFKLFLGIDKNNEKNN